MDNFEYKIRQLRKYAHHLKTQLKTYSGESVRKGGTIERKLAVYKKLRKLFHYLDEKKQEIKDDKNIKQVDTYYDLLKGKIEKLNAAVKEEKKSQLPPSPLRKARVDRTEKEIVDSDVEDEPVGNNNYNQDDNENDNNEEDDEEDGVITEVGPTPQLNGRVLTIFDIQTSPEKFVISPMKNKTEPNLGINLGEEDIHQLNPIEDDEIFKTPSKPFTHHAHDNHIYNHLSSSSRKLNFDEVQTTPVKKIINLEQDFKLTETPRYLRSQSTSLKTVDEIIIGEEWSEDEFDDETSNDPRFSDEDDDEADMELPDMDDKIEHINIIEPSPIIKKRGRSLFDLHKDLVSLKRNLTDLEETIECDNMVKEEIDELKSEGAADADGVETKAEPGNDNEGSGDEGEEEKEHTIENVFDPHYKLRNKIKTIKRSTKRARLKTDKLNLKDELDKVDIHALAFGNPAVAQLDVGLNGPMQYSDDEDDEEEEYVRKDVKELEKELNVGKSKGKGKHPLSNNFVRLKINRGGKKGGRFGRRR